MKPMDIDAVRGLVAMYGGAPDHTPQTTTVRRFEDYDNPTHPLQAWIDELPPWQVEAIFFKAPETPTREAWDEAWAQAIYNALWY